MVPFLVLVAWVFVQVHGQTYHTYNCDSTHDCSDKEFIFPKTSGTHIYEFNCKTAGDCNNLIVYHGEKGSFYVNCEVTNACNNIQIYVGNFDPPGETYDSTHMTGSISATIYCKVATGCNGVYFSCKGNGISLCSLWAASGYDPIVSSTVECNTDALCEFDCDYGCSGTNKLLCHTGSSLCQCANGCGTAVARSTGVTYVPTTSVSTTSIPTTSLPTTAIPTTYVPTTTMPTTSVPTTAIPTTTNPSTIQPTTKQPTTTAPTTIVPTTNLPTTTIPTSNQPSTSNPTTWQPSTIQPTTATPTTKQIHAEDSMTTTMALNDGGVTEEATSDGASNNGNDKQKSNSKSGLDSMTLYIIIGVSAAIIMICFVLVCVHRKKKKSKSQQDAQNIDGAGGIELHSSNYGIDSTSPISTNTTMSGNTVMGAKKTGEGESISISNDKETDDLEMDGNEMNGTGDNILSESDNDTDDNLYETNDHVTAGGNDHVTAGGDIDLLHEQENIEAVEDSMDDMNGTHDMDAMYSDSLRNVTTGR